MSVESLQEFVSRVEGDSSLQQELETAVAGKDGLAASQAVSEVGAKYGYSFTAEEAEAGRKAVLAEESGELSEGELESVAGGFLRFGGSFQVSTPFFRAGGSGGVSGW